MLNRHSAAPIAAFIVVAGLLSGCTGQAPQPSDSSPATVQPTVEPTADLVQGCDDLLTAAQLSDVIGSGIVDADPSATYGGPPAPQLDGALLCRWVDSAEADAVQPTVEIALSAVEDDEDDFAAGAGIRAEERQSTIDLGDGLPVSFGAFGAQSETFCQVAGPGPDCSFQGRANDIWFELRIVTGERLVEQWISGATFEIDLEGVRDSWAALAPRLVDRLEERAGLVRTGERAAAVETTCAELFDAAALSAATGLTLLDPDEEMPAPDADSARIYDRIAAASPTVLRNCRLDDGGEYRSMSTTIGSEPWWEPDATAEPVQLRWSISRVLQNGRLLQCQNVLEQRCTLSVGVAGAVLSLDSASTFDEGDGGWADPSKLDAELDAMIEAYRA